MVADSRVCTVSTDEDMSLVRGAVRASNQDVLAVLIKADNLFAEMDLLTGNMAPKQIMQVGPGKDILAVGSTMKEFK